MGNLTNTSWGFGARCAIAACAAMAGAAAMAEDADPYADYVKLTRSDNSWARPNSSFCGVGGWDDGLAPHSDTNYYVAANRNMYYTGVNTGDYAVSNSWFGGKLVIAGKFYTTVGWGHQYGPRIPDLTLLGGSEVLACCYGPFYEIDANTPMRVTIDSTLDNPVTISSHYSQSRYSSGGFRNNELRAKIFGTAESALVLTRPFTNYGGTAIDNGFYFTTTSDEATFADFPGTVILRGGNTIFSTCAWYVTGYNFPLTTFRVEDGARALFHYVNTFYNNAMFRETAQLKGFELIDGTAEFAYASSRPCPTIVATNSFILGAKGKFVVPITKANVIGVKPGETRANYVKLAHLEGPAAANATVENGFTVALRDAPILDDEADLKLVDNGDGTKDLWLGGEFVTMTNTNVESSGYPAGSVQYGALDGKHPEDWSNGVTPPADSTLDYFAQERLCNFVDVSIPNATLTYGTSASWKGGGLFQFKEFRFLAGNSFGMWGGGDRVMRAERIRIFPAKSGTFTLYCGSLRSFLIDAPLAGTGDFTLRNYDDMALPSIGLAKPSPDFHGKFKLTQYNKGNATTPYNVKATICSALNFGGVYTGADTNAAVEFADRPLVYVTNAVCFAEPTRGVKVTGGVKFDVAAGASLTFSNRVTWAGEFVKSGAGQLALAGEACFRDGSVATAPLAGTNVLVIAGGSLVPGSLRAADGLAISFAAGAKLVLPADADDDVAQYGLYDVKWDSPLAFADAKLKVALAGDAPKTRTVRGICTVSAAAAESLSDSSFAVERVPGCRTRVSHVSNSDGTVTFSVSAIPVGTAIIVR